MAAIGKFYAGMIKRGRITIDDVPPQYREVTEDALKTYVVVTGLSVVA